jgi:hypothetical protein
MRRRVAAVVCAVAFAALAGCADWRRHPAPRLSIKDHAPARAAQPVQPKPEPPAPKAQMPAPPKTAPPAAPKAEPPAIPKTDAPPAPAPEPPAAPKTELPVQPRAELSIQERAEREQASWCGQRHVEHNAGTLAESEEQKRVRDGQCTELHKRDYVR